MKMIFLIIGLMVAFHASAQEQNLASRLIRPENLECIQKRTCVWDVPISTLIVQRVIHPEALVFFCKGITTSKTGQSLTIADMGDHLRFVYYLNPDEIYLIGYPFPKDRKLVKTALKRHARNIAGLSAAFFRPFIASHSFNQGVTQNGWNWSSSPMKVGHYAFFRLVYDLGVGNGFYHEPEISVPFALHLRWVRSVGYEN